MNFLKTLFAGVVKGLIPAIIAGFVAKQLYLRVFVSRDDLLEIGSRAIINQSKSISVLGTIVVLLVFVVLTFVKEKRQSIDQVNSVEHES